MTSKLLALLAALALGEYLLSFYDESRLDSHDGLYTRRRKSRAADIIKRGSSRTRCTTHIIQSGETLCFVTLIEFFFSPGGGLSIKYIYIIETGTRWHNAAEA